MGNIHPTQRIRDEPPRAQEIFLKKNENISQRAPEVAHGHEDLLSVFLVACTDYRGGYKTLEMQQHIGDDLTKRRDHTPLETDVRTQDLLQPLLARFQKAGRIVKKDTSAFSSTAIVEPKAQLERSNDAPERNVSGGTGDVLHSSQPCISCDSGRGYILNDMLVFAWQNPHIGRHVATVERRASRALDDQRLNLCIPTITHLTIGNSFFCFVPLAPISSHTLVGGTQRTSSEMYCSEADALCSKLRNIFAQEDGFTGSRQIHCGMDGVLYFLGNADWLPLLKPIRNCSAKYLLPKDIPQSIETEEGEQYYDLKVTVPPTALVPPLPRVPATLLLQSSARLQRRMTHEEWVVDFLVPFAARYMKKHYHAPNGMTFEQFFRATGIGAKFFAILLAHLFHNCNVYPNALVVWLQSRILSHALRDVIIEKWRGLRTKDGQLDVVTRVLRALFEFHGPPKVVPALCSQTEAKGLERTNAAALWVFNNVFPTIARRYIVVPGMLDWCRPVSPEVRELTMQHLQSLLGISLARASPVNVSPVLSLLSLSDFVAPTDQLQELAKERENDPSSTLCFTCDLLCRAVRKRNTKDVLQIVQGVERPRSGPGKLRPERRKSSRRSTEKLLVDDIDEELVAQSIQLVEDASRLDAAMALSIALDLMEAAVLDTPSQTKKERAELLRSLERHTTCWRLRVELTTLADELASQLEISHSVMLFGRFAVLSATADPSARLSLLKSALKHTKRTIQSNPRPYLYSLKTELLSAETQHYLEVARYSDALSTSSQCDKTATKAWGRQGYASLSNLGVAFHRMAGENNARLASQFTNQSVTILQHAAELARAKNDFPFCYGVELNVAVAFHLLGNSKKAELMVDEIIEALREHKEAPRLLAEALRNRAAVEFLHEEYDTVKVTLDEANTIYPARPGEELNLEHTRELMKKAHRRAFLLHALANEHFVIKVQRFWRAQLARKKALAVIQKMQEGYRALFALEREVMKGRHEIFGMEDIGRGELQLQLLSDEHLLPTLLFSLYSEEESAWNVITIEEHIGNEALMTHNQLYVLQAFEASKRREVHHLVEVQSHILYHRLQMDLHVAASLDHMKTVYYTTAFEFVDCSEEEESMQIVHHEWAERMLLLLTLGEERVMNEAFAAFFRLYKAEEALLVERTQAIERSMLEGREETSRQRKQDFALIKLRVLCHNHTIEVVFSVLEALHEQLYIASKNAVLFRTMTSLEGLCDAEVRFRSTLQKELLSNFFQFHLEVMVENETELRIALEDRLLDQLDDLLDALSDQCHSTCDIDSDDLEGMEEYVAFGEAYTEDPTLPATKTPPEEKVLAPHPPPGNPKAATGIRSKRRSSKSLLLPASDPVRQHQVRQERELEEISKNIEERQILLDNLRKLRAPKDPSPQVPTK